MRARTGRGLAALVAGAAGLAGAPDGRAQGVSAEEYERVTPQAPRAVKVERGPGGAAIVSWTAPLAPPEGRIAYERRVTRYRVYRGPPGEERLVGETRDRRLVDTSAPPGAGYVVTAVHGEGQESGRTDPVRLAR